MAGEPVVEDQQRQRTLKALERRFEAAQAELDLQKKKTVKRPKTEEAGKKSHIPTSSAVDSSAKSSNASASRSTPSKKGFHSRILALFLLIYFLFCILV